MLYIHLIKSSPNQKDALPPDVLIRLQPDKTPELELPICRNHPGLHQQAASAAAAVADTPDTPGNHPGAAAALAAAEAAERYARASVAAV
jgi:hypothetical protein